MNSNYIRSNTDRLIGDDKRANGNLVDELIAYIFFDSRLVQGLMEEPSEKKKLAGEAATAINNMLFGSMIHNKKRMKTDRVPLTTKSSVSWLVLVCL